MIKLNKRGAIIIDNIGLIMIRLLELDNKNREYFATI